MIRFGVLGPLDVRVGDGVVDLGGARQRALLAALLVHAREPVPAEALAQMVWGDEAPAGAAKTLQVNVSRLRGALGAAGDRVETVSGGYRLRVEPGELDAETFEQAYERARALAPADAAPALRDALTLWRGPALADLRYAAWAQGEIRRLEELRAAAIEDRVAAALELGEHGRLVGELEALVAEHPHSERLRGLQMLALYRAGRHADALAAFRAARATLDAELGLEPGPELRRLEQQILTHDPSLAMPAPGVPPPPPTPTFGRDEDIRAVLTALDSARLLTLVGPGGVGKTRLAIDVARAAGGRFVSLASTAEAERVPGTVCDALGVARAPGDSDLQALDRALDRGAGLLVLDNLEHLPGAAGLLAGLLERHSDLTVLATSRRPLEIRAERQFPVEPLAGAPAAALFSDRARARDPSFALTEDDAAIVSAVCERLGGLPLAIELAAARLAVLTPTALAGRLDDALGVLDRGPQDAPQRQQTLRATLDWSYDLLDADERGAFSALGVFAGGCELDAAEAVTGHPLAVLESLVAHSLVGVRDGRMTLLEPVRQYAAARLAARPDAEAVRARHCAHLLALAERADPEIWIRALQAPEFAAVHRERDNFEAAVEAAFASGRYVDALALAGALGTYAEFRRTDEQVFRWCARALDAAGPDAPAGLRARALVAQLGMKFDDGAAERVSAAVELYRQTGDDTGIVRALIMLARIHSSMGDLGAARAAADEALDRARRLGDRGRIGAALGEIALAIPDIEAALPFAREAVTELRAVGATARSAGLLSSLGMAALDVDAHDRAEQLEREALDLALEIDDQYLLTLVHGNMGLAMLLGGRPEAARGAFTAEYERAHRNGYVRFFFEAQLGLAAVAAAAGQDRRAATLHAAAWAGGDRLVYPTEAPIYDRVEQRFIAAARSRLDPRAWDAAAAAGRALPADAVLAFALAEPTVTDR